MTLVIQIFERRSGCKITKQNIPGGYGFSTMYIASILKSSFLKEVLNRLRMYGNGYSMAIVLDHRYTATSLTANPLDDLEGGGVIRF